MKGGFIGRADGSVPAGVIPTGNVAADDAYDNAHGIAEGSARDIGMDRAHGIHDDAGSGKTGGNSFIGERRPANLSTGAHVGDQPGIIPTRK